MTTSTSTVTFLTSAVSGARSYISDINDQGETVGTSIWQAGAILALPLPAGDTRWQASAVNDQGEIVGYSQSNSFSPEHATIWQNGTATQIGNAQDFSVASDVNQSGQVVGTAGQSSTTGQAFLWQNGVMTFLPGTGAYGSAAYGINDSGLIVGEVLTSSTLGQAVLWQNGAVTDLGTLPGGVSSAATAVNNQGQVVGNSLNSFYTAFLWQNGQMQALNPVSGYNQSVAEGINDAGIVVGRSDKFGSADTVATVWENGVAIDLNTLLPSNYTGGLLVEASAINDKDQVVATDFYGLAYVISLDAAEARPSAAAAAQSFTAGTLSAAAAIVDTAANVQSQLDTLQTIASAGLISSISLSDQTTPTIEISASQLERDSAALQDIQGYYRLVIDGPVTASAVTSNVVNLAVTLSVSDSAANVSANIRNLEAAAEYGQDQLTIHLTDSGTPTLTIDASLASSFTDALKVISDPYQVALIDAPASTAIQYATDANITSFSISDTETHVSEYIDALETLAVAGRLDTINLYPDDFANNVGGIPTLEVTAAQFTADADAIAKITGQFTAFIFLNSPGKSLTIDGIAGHATIVSVGDFSYGYKLAVTSDGDLTVSDGTYVYTLDQIQELQFSDASVIVAQTPGSQGHVTTGNIAELYSAVLAREPDAAGLYFYQSYLQTNPNTQLLQFAEWFLASPEYTGNTAHNYAQTTAGETQFITDSYQNLLNRTPSSDEIAYYLTNVIQPALKNLTAGTAAYTAADTQAHAQMLVYFSASPEFLSDVQVTAQSPASAQHWLVLV